MHRLCSAAALGVLCLGLVAVQALAQPALARLDPDAAEAGSADTAVTITGSGFTPATSFEWDGVALAAMVDSASSARVIIRSSLLTTVGTATIRARSAEGALSNSLTFTIRDPLKPVIARLEPSNIVATQGGFTLTVIGTGLAPGSAVYWNATRLDTVVESTVRATAFVPEDLIAYPGVALVAVQSPAGVRSSPLEFIIGWPLPQITSLTPSSVVAGLLSLNLTIHGSGFVRGATVRFNNVIEIPAVVLSSRQLTVFAPVALLALHGIITIQVVNADRRASASVQLLVNPPPPALEAVSPTSTPAGTPNLNLVLSGSNFQPRAIARWNGIELATTFNSPTQLTAAVPANLMTSASIVSIVVQNPDGLSSSAIPFQVTPVSPRITSLEPASVSAGSASFTLTVNGTNFQTGAAIRWNNVPLSTTFLSATQLRAGIPADWVANAGSATIVVGNPDGLASNSQTFTIGPAPAPQLLSLNPVSATAGGPAFPLRLNGSNFRSGAVARWNDTPLETTFDSATQLTALVPASLIAAAGVAQVSVANPDGQSSRAVAFAISSAAPVLSSLTPASAPAGAPGFLLTVSGANFQEGASVLWNGGALSTTFLSSTGLSANVTAPLLTMPGEAQVTVRNPDSQTTLPLLFRITLAAPRITGLTPTSALAGGPGFQLNLAGTNFQNGAVAYWNDTPLTTAYGSSTALQANVSASLIASAGTASIYVRNPDNQISPAAMFVVESAAPRILSLSPATVAAGSAGFTLTVNGADFREGATVLWAGSPLATAYVGPGQLTATVAETLLQRPGVVNVIVTNSDGRASSPARFTITAQPPRITSLAPASATAGGPAFTLTVSGANFQEGAQVRWNGLALATQFSSSGVLTAEVPAAQIAVAGAINISVVNPDEQASPAVVFQVTAVAPRITQLTPSSAFAGSGSFALSVLGSNFRSGATVRWNGAVLPTTFLGETQLTANVDASLVAAAGSASVTVANPDGQTSAATVFLIQWPAPRLTSISPSSAPVGSPSVTLTLTGRDFRPGATVRWNGEDIPATFVSSTELTAVIPAPRFTATGSVQVVVANPDGQTSGALPFLITAAAPEVTSLRPNSVQAGSPAFTLSLTGAHFQPGASLRWNGTPLEAAFVSATELSASISASLVAAAGRVNIVVVNPDNQASAAYVFTVLQAAAPTLTSLTPSSAVAGGAAFTLVASGSAFVEGAALWWNETPLVTSFVSSSQLSATVPATLIASPASVSIRVRNPDGQSSAERTFGISLAPPRLTSLLPASAFAGSPAFRLTLRGASFVSGSVARWNGAPLETQFVSDSELTAAIPAKWIASPGSFLVSVVNPDSQVSAPVSFTVDLAPPPSLTALTPSTVVAGAAAFTLNLRGQNFQTGAEVRWNGVALPTRVLSSGEALADVSAGHVAQAETVSVVLANPDGQASAPLQFQVSARPPRLTSLDPNTAQATGPAFVLRVSGSDFRPGATVRWNSTVLAATRLSETEMTADVPANLIAAAGSAAIVVANRDGSESNPLSFSISQAPAPSITNLTPNSVQAAAPAFELLLDGAHFQNGAVVKWNGAALSTTFVSASQLRVSITAALVATAGTATLTVTNADGQVSGAALFTITPAPAPTLLSVDPSSALAGSSAISITLAGSNFQSGAAVRWNNAPLPTTRLSATQLSANVDAALLASAGQASITVANPDGQTTQALTFQIRALPPQILSFIPAVVQAGGQDFSLVVEGQRFQSGAVVKWNDAPLTTTFLSAGRVSAAVPAVLIQKAGSVSISVVNPDQQASPPVNFSIGAAPAPLITALSPTSARVGGPAFTLTVTGANFRDGAVVKWNGTALTTFEATPSQITASVPASLLTAAGAISITVQNPDGQVSAAADFALEAQPPQISALSPASIAAGSEAFTLTVNGAYFQEGAVIRWAGAPLPTAFVSASQLTASAPATLVAQAGSAAITVRNPDRQRSNEFTFTVGPAMRPVITAASPNAIPAGSPTTVVTFNGNNFRSGAVISWNGTQVATTYVSATQVTAVASANLLVKSGPASVTLRNPDGQTSDAFALQVTPAGPVVTVLSPASAPAQSPDFVLVAHGRNFTQNAEIVWNGIPLPTIFRSSAELAATIGATLTPTPGEIAVTVRNSDGSVSAPLPFTVENPTPQLLSLSPSSIASGSPAFSLSVSGARFAPGARVLLDGVEAPTVAVSGTQLVVNVPAAIVANPKAISVTVRNPENQISNSLRFNVTEVSVPEISRLSPSSAAVNSPSFAMTVSGFNFQNGADVLWNGAVLQTTFLSATELTANVPASLLLAIGQAHITVRNPGGRISEPLPFEIGAALEITTGARLPDAVAGRAVRLEMEATGGARPYLWSLTPASRLPEGLTLEGSGLLQGVPTVAGDYSFEIEVRDSTQVSARRIFQLKVAAGELLITSASPLPPGTAGSPYSFRFQLSETNLTQVDWSLLEGALPAGVSLQPATGELTGTPLEPAGAGEEPRLFRFRVQATAGMRRALRDFEWTVSPAITPFQIATPSPLPAGRVNRYYRTAIGAVGGRLPYVYTLDSGSLPEGLSLSSDGVVEGSPAVAGEFQFSVSAQDADGQAASRGYSLTIAATGAIEITTGPLLPVAAPGQPYTHALAASGGRQPYRWSLLSGGLPLGLTFDSTGRLSGAALQEGRFSFTVSVADADGLSDTQEFVLPVLLSGDDPLRFTSVEPPDTMLGASYEFTLSGLGGLPPYRFAVVSGALPEGIRLEGASLRGVALQAGSFPLVISLTDARGVRTDASLGLDVRLAPLRSVRLSGVSEQINPGQQTALTLDLSSAYPVDVAGVLELTFTSAVASTSSDPAVQFSTGGRRVEFVVPAGQTRAVFPQSMLGLQAGTVAGSIRFRAALKASGQDLTPEVPFEFTVIVPETPPVISSAALTRVPGGFQLTLTGFSSTREVSQGIITLMAAAGHTLQSTRVTIPLDGAFKPWYDDAQSQPFGSQFRLVLPFTGDSASVESLTIVLRNARGDSNEMRVAF